MIRKIDAEIVVESQHEAEALDAALSASGASTSVGWKHGKWTVFANYDQNDAEHVGRTIIDFDFDEGEAA